MNNILIGYEKNLVVERRYIDTKIKYHYIALYDDETDKYLLLFWDVIATFQYRLSEFLRECRVNSSLQSEEFAIEVLDLDTFRIGSLTSFYDEEMYDFFIDVKIENFLEVFSKFEQFKSLNIQNFQLMREDNKIGIAIL